MQNTTVSKWMSKNKKVDSNREALSHKEEAEAKEKTLQIQREIASLDKVVILHGNLANQYKLERDALRVKMMVQTDGEHEDERLRHNELIALEIAEDRKMLQAMMCKRQKNVKDTKFF